MATSCFLPDYILSFYSSLDRDIPSDPLTKEDVAHVLKHGYVILKDCFSTNKAQQAKDEIERLSRKHGGKVVQGCNGFEGLNTSRICSLMNKSRVFDDFTVIPRVLALNSYFLDPGFLIPSFHTITINQNSAAQTIHHDDAFSTLPRPRPPLDTAIIVAFDEFTKDNGATRLIPGSHLWGPKSGNNSSSTLLKSTPDASLTIPALYPAGSVVYFISTLWNSGGANAQSTPRNSLTVQYCQPYIRRIENQFLCVDPRRLDEVDPRIVSMLGYSTFAGFIGYADALNPREGARRMIQWLGKPLSDVSTFHRHDEESKAIKSKM